MKNRNVVVASAVAVLAGVAGSASAQYCQPSTAYTTCNTAYEYIARVQFNTIDQSSGCDVPATGTGGYENYTGVSTTVIRGTTQTLTVTVGTPWAADRLYAWVDWNNDFVFDTATEQYVLTNNLGAGNTVVSVPVGIPTNATLGNVRMRVRLTYNTNPDPCNTQTYGQVEDYTLNVQNATTPLPPTGTGAATPASAQITASTLLKVNVQPGLNPASTGLAVRGDLTAFHGSNNQQFYDDGSHGDVTAGDSVFSYLATLAEPMTPGSYTIPFTVSDAQARSSGGNISVTATAAPTGGCCVSGACQLLTAYNCAQSGGTYNGNGSSCTIASSSNAFSSIVGSGTETMLGTASNCDDCTEALALPFTFNFYGQDYTSCYVSSNGNIHFGTSTTAYFNDAIPTAAAPNNAIYVFWDDLNTATQGDIYYQVRGTSPNQQLLIEWNNVSQYTAGGTYPVTSENFQMVLFEGSNNIEFRYGSITPSRTDNLQNGTGIGPGGDDYTIGIENASGTAASWVPGTSLASGNVSLLLNSNTSVVNCGSACPGGQCGPQDYNGDGDSGTDQDIEAFFACLGGNCCATCFCQASDFNGDGDFGTDQDIEAFFRVLGGSSC